jgi:hypothetical protein
LAEQEPAWSLLFHGDGQPFNPDRFRRELEEGVKKVRWPQRRAS